MRLLIVTPTLGQSPFLGKLCSSVQDALPANAQHIIICPSDCVGIVREQAPNAQIIEEGQRRGIFGCLNDFIQHFGPDYDYVTYINDDDQLLPGFWVTWHDVVRGVINEDIVYGRVQFLLGDTRKVFEIPQVKQSEHLEAAVMSGLMPLTQQGVIFSMRVFTKLNGFDEKYSLCADSDFWFRAILTKQFGILWRDQLHANYRIWPGQLSSDQRRQSAEMAAIRAGLPKCAFFERLLAHACFYSENVGVYLNRVLGFGFRSVRDIMVISGKYGI